MASNREKSLLELFWVFAKIGAFTLGGGYAMIALIEREVVSKRKWMSIEEFAQSLAIAQSTPGLLAVNISIFVGYSLFKERGSIVATLGASLPSFLIILIIAFFFGGYRDNIYVERFFRGVRPAVVALIASAVFSMTKKFGLRPLQILIAATIALLIIFLKVSPIYIILIGIALFATLNYFREEREKI